MAITRITSPAITSVASTAISGTIPQGNIANASLGAVTALPGAIATGKVLQVVSVTKTDTFTSSSSSFTDITGLTANITPSSTSNKILVIANHTNTRSNGATQVGLKLFRDSTEIRQSRFLADTSSSARNHISVTIVALDTPSSTSQITYKTQFNNEQGTSTASVNQGDASGPSTITLMEIAG